jgi:Lhr-like helicase
MMRDVISAPPPGANGLIQRIGFVGHICAAPCVAITLAINANADRDDKINLKILNKNI